MPEGHVVHADARRFTAAMAGRVVRARSPQGRFAAGAAVLDGRMLCAAQAYGKNLFVRFSESPTPYLHVHLGLIGAWTWWDAASVQTAGRPTRTASDSGVRLRLTGPDGVSAELRGMTTCALLDERAMDLVVGSLGPDPLRADADESLAWARIRGSRVPIGALLLDQSVIAGAGLIWRCEVPFLAGISPHRPGRSLGEDDWTRLWHELRRNMLAAVDDGTPSFYVFRRGGEPCLRCGTTVEVATLGGRKVWWCPHHQPY